MHTHIAALAQSLFVLAVFAVPSFAQDEEALKKDLTAVIALQGLPCGQVVAVKVQAESDFAVSCKDGNMYRVYLSAAGRVVVETRRASNERELPRGAFMPARSLVDRVGSKRSASLNWPARSPRLARTPSSKLLVLPMNCARFSGMPISSGAAPRRSSSRLASRSAWCSRCTHAPRSSASAPRR